VAKCVVCGKPGVYTDRLTGRVLCKKHFLEHFDRKVRRTIRRYEMLGRREHIVVATSGGKDSLSLLHYLYGLSKNVPGWRISALLIDEGIKGYREYTVKDMLRVVEDLGIPYRIVSFKEYFGLTLDEIVETGKKRGLPYLPCSYCGVFRRYLLNRIAREMGATVLATAHNLDDTIQTFLLNVLRNSWERVVRQGPVTGIIDHPKFVRRIKPFVEVTEKETATYALLQGLVMPEFYECPYVYYNVRVSIRRFINELEERHPGIKYSMLRSMLTVIDLLTKNHSLKGEISECRICGEPSSHEICRACFYRYKLGIMESREMVVAEEVFKHKKP